MTKFDSPLLESERQAWDSLLRLRNELQKELDRLPEVKVSKACRRLLKLLEKQKYGKLKSELIGKRKLEGFCFADDIAEGLDCLLRLAPDPLIDDFLGLVIRLAYSERTLTNNFKE